MISKKILDRCLRAYAEIFPDHREVIVIVRDDDRIRIINKMHDSLLFSPTGKMTFEIEDRTGVNPREGFFELLPETV